jgi:hypothetical protein
VYPVFHVSPVSAGQSSAVECALKELAERNGCTTERDASAKRFQLARDVKALELDFGGRKLEVAELMQVLRDWHCRSQPFLDPAKTFDDHWEAFLAELSRVRVPTGAGALAKVVAAVSQLPLDQLVQIPGYPNAPADYRRQATLHRDVRRLSPGDTHFLSYRDAAKVSDGMTAPRAHRLTWALVTLGVIEIANRGKPGRRSKQATEYRYLLEEDDDFVL